MNANSSYDLSTIVGGSEVPKEVTGIYIVQNGTSFTEYSNPVSGAKYVTKVTNQATGDVAYIDAPPGGVSDLLTNPSCSACVDSTTQSVEIVSSCTDPVFVQVCGTAEQEIEFTDAIPICVDNADGTFSTWYTREVVIWDQVNFSIISRTTEYSSNGISWSSTAPSGTFTLGACSVGEGDCELIVTNPIPYCVKFVSSSNSDPCCGVTAAVYQQWYIREKIIWDSIACLEVSKIVEYSDDAVNWYTTPPANGILGECPEEHPVNDSACCPSISEAFADDLSTLLSSHNYVITKPQCCKIKVTTSIGSFHVLENVQSYTTSDFNCLVDITSVEIVSGSCTLDKIQIIGNKLK